MSLPFEESIFLNARPLFVCPVEPYRRVLAMVVAAQVAVDEGRQSATRPTVYRGLEALIMDGFDGLREAELDRLLLVTNDASAHRTLGAAAEEISVANIPWGQLPGLTSVVVITGPFAEVVARHDPQLDTGESGFLLR